MTRQDQLESLAEWKPRAIPFPLDQLERVLACEFPGDYRRFLERGMGFEGWFGQGYLVLHAAEDLEAVNREAQIPEFHPEHVLIGGNGGGEWIFLNLRTRGYVMIPSVGCTDDGIPQGRTFEELLDRVHEDRLFDR